MQTNSNNAETIQNNHTEEKQSQPQPEPEPETKETLQGQMTDSSVKESEADCTDRGSVPYAQNRKKKKLRKKSDIPEHLLEVESSNVIVKPATVKLGVAQCRSSHGSFGDDEMDY